MRIIFNAEGRAIATANDEYTGADVSAPAPGDFNPELLAEYTFVDGAVVLAPTARVTRLAFRNRFSQPEKVTLELAALDNPAAPQVQRQQAAALRAYLADVAAATFVDLLRPDTRQGVQFLESSGLLAQGRALEILDAPVQAEERPL